MASYNRDPNKPQTSFITLQGKAGWYYLDQPDTMFTPEGKWSIEIYMDGPSYEKMLELKTKGCKNTIKTTDDGYKAILSRPTQKIYSGRWKAFEPPQIEDKDGNPLPRTTRFGHGSDITLTVEVYWTKPRPTAEYQANARLAAVRLDNPIPYTRDDYNQKQERVVKTQDKAPVQTW